VADIDGKLLFTAPADGSGRLVFGYEGDSSAAPGAELGVDGDFPEMDGVTTLVIAYDMALDGDFPAMEGDVGLQYDSGVFRGTRVGLEFCWQEAVPVAARLATAWQVSEAHVARLVTSWQAAMPLAARVDALWQETERLQARLATAWQNAEPLITRLASAWQETIRLESRLATDWQQAVPVSTRLASAWQETLHLSALMDARWQQAIPTRTELRTSFGDGRLVARRLDARWQEATWPRSGESLPPVIAPPEKELCYDPATVARLVFSEAWDGTGKLVFVCKRKGGGTDPEPIETVVVPVREVYIVLNSILLRRVSDGLPIPAYSFSMSLDIDSWTWSWQASLHSSTLAYIQPEDGSPVEVEAVVNNVPYRLLVERFSRERSFAKTRIEVTGRGRAAMLDAPYAPMISHVGRTTMSAQQLAIQALNINGAPIGWSLDWKLEDWIVPAGSWALNGSYIAALTDIASAVGGYVQPHNTEQTLRLLPRYPKQSWLWGSITPDYQLPADAVSVEATEWLTNADYNSVFVAGEGAGVLGQVTRAGTAGDRFAPMVTHPLITDMDAARQRGIAELSPSGRQQRITLSLQVLPQTGVIKPGSFVRYMEGANSHLGLVRGTSVGWDGGAKLRQSINLEVPEVSYG